MTAGEFGGFSIVAQGLDTVGLAAIGCLRPAPILAPSLDTTARKALQRLADVLALSMRGVHVGEHWGESVAAAAQEVNRCRAGEWPVVRPGGRRSSFTMHDINVPAYWGAWAITSALSVYGASRRAQHRWDAANCAWATLALTLESRALAGIDGTAPAALWAKANRTLAAIGPLVGLIGPDSHHRHQSDDDLERPMVFAAAADVIAQARVGEVDPTNHEQYHRLLSDAEVDACVATWDQPMLLSAAADYVAQARVGAADCATHIIAYRNALLMASAALRRLLDGPSVKRDQAGAA